VFGLLAGGVVEVAVDNVLGFDEVVGGMVEDGLALLVGYGMFIGQLRGVSLPFLEWWLITYPGSNQSFPVEPMLLYESETTNWLCQSQAVKRRCPLYD
jgi:hypothetical protein